MEHAKSLLIMTALLLGASAPAAARGLREADSGAEIAVSYADLDLTSASGVRALNGRIARAARDYCRAAVAGGIGRMIDEHDCVAAIVAHAQPQLAQAIGKAEAGYAAVADRRGGGR